MVATRESQVFLGIKKLIEKKYPRFASFIVFEKRFKSCCFTQKLHYIENCILKDISRSLFWWLMFLVLYGESNRGLGRTWSNSNDIYHCWIQKKMKYLHISPDVVSTQWADFSEFARNFLTYQLLPIIQCIRIRTQSGYWNNFYLVRSLTATSISWNFLLISSLLFSANSSR